MNLPALPFDSGHLTEALVHFNEAADREDRGAPSTAVAEALYWCLNKLQTGHASAAEPGREVAGFKALVESAVSADDRFERFLGPELRALAALIPQVMNHQTLRRRGYRPGSEMSEDLLKETTEEHHGLTVALERLDHRSAAEARGQIVKRAAVLLYVVRSNIAHGEKTPYGPDLEKRSRDEEVCRLVVPLCRLIIDLALGRPSERLVAYGTLAPGMPNHSVVEDINGRWLPCTIEAALKTVQGLPLMEWKPGSSLALDAMLLESEHLPAHWQRLDEFEGSLYLRRLIPVSVLGSAEQGGVVAASAYLAN